MLQIQNFSFIFVVILELNGCTISENDNSSLEIKADDKLFYETAK